MSLQLQASYPDVCGVATSANGFVFTTVQGRVFGQGAGQEKQHSFIWDNHLVAI